MKEGLQVGLTTMATTEDHRKDPYEGKSGGGASGKTQITQSGVEAIKETIKCRARTLLLNMQVGMNVPEKKRMGITTLAMNNPSLHRQIMEQAEQEQVAEAKEAAKAAATAAERADLEKEFAAKTEVLRAAREKARVAEAAAKEAGNDGTDAGEFDEDGDEGGNLTWDEFQRVRGKKYEYAQDLSHLRWKASVTTDQWRAHNAEARKQRAERSISEVESALLEALPAEKVARAGRRMAVKRAFPVFNTQHVEEAADARRGERRSGVLGSDELIAASTALTTVIRTPEEAALAALVEAEADLQDAAARMRAAPAGSPTWTECEQEFAAKTEVLRIAQKKLREVKQGDGLNGFSKDRSGASHVVQAILDLQTKQDATPKIDFGTLAQVLCEPCNVLLLLSLFVVVVIGLFVEMYCVVVLLCV
jgi:hypothetical protein